MSIVTRVAIVHDWLTGMRGGERVLEAILDLFPSAEIFTLFHRRGAVSRRIEDRPIHTSALQHAPFRASRYRSYLPLYPLALRTMRIRGFDLVVSSSHCVAKASLTEGTPHLCYCHTPMRYIWDQLDAYVRPGSWGYAPTLAAASLLRKWDVATTDRVDAFVANSHHVRDRIRRCYQRDAVVVHPPVDLDRFGAARQPEDFYLVVSALVPYKRIDLAVGACARLGRPLVIAGDGPEAARLRRMAPPSTRFLGSVSDEEVARLYSRCRAFLFTGVEDFGITAVEAQAAGAPVVALAAGGALETVAGPLVEAGDQAREDRIRSPNATGVFFGDPSIESLVAAMEYLDGMELDDYAARRNAERFAPARFREGMLRAIVGLLAHEESQLHASAPAFA